MPRTGRAQSWLVAAAVLACQVGSSEAEGEHPEKESSGPAVDAKEGDPLLARARQSLRRGKIDPATLAELLASVDPAHARARRLLSAMARETDGGEQDSADTPERPSLMVPEVGEGNEAASSP